MIGLRTAGLAVLVLGLGMSHGWAYRSGLQAERARHLRLELEAERKAAETAARLAAEEQKARLLAQALEDQAYAEPSTVGGGISRTRVLRLNNR